MRLRLYADRFATMAILLSLIVVISDPALAAPHQTAMVDRIADYLSVFVIVVVPIVGIGLFLMVHVLPEKIAERRHHPQKDAITTLCMLSLVFGGMLWPLAWLWAFTKPVAHKMAYGTDKSDEYYHELGHRLFGQIAQGQNVDEDAHRLLRELDLMDSRHPLSDSLRALRRNLAGFCGGNSNYGEGD